MAVRDSVIDNPRLREIVIRVKAVDNDTGKHGIVYMSGMCGLGSRVKALCMRFDIVDETTTLHDGKDELFFYGPPSVLRANFNRVPSLLFDKRYIAYARNLVIRPMKAMYRGKLTTLPDHELRIPFEDVCLGDARKECARELVKTTEKAWEEFRKNLKPRKRGDTKRWSSVAEFPCDLRAEIDKNKRFYSCVYRKHQPAAIDETCRYHGRLIGLPAFRGF